MSLEHSHAILPLCLFLLWLFWLPVLPTRCSPAFMGPLGDWTIKQGDVEAAIASAPRSVSGTFLLPSVKHMYMEPQVTVARPRDGGGLWVATATQSPSAAHVAAAAVLGVPQHHITVGACWCSTAVYSCYALGHSRFGGVPKQPCCAHRGVHVPWAQRRGAWEEALGARPVARCLPCWQPVWAALRLGGRSVWKSTETWT